MDSNNHFKMWVYCTWHSFQHNKIKVLDVSKEYTVAQPIQLSRERWSKMCTHSLRKGQSPTNGRQNAYIHQRRGKGSLDKVPV